MRLLLSQRWDIIKKTDLCQLCFEHPKGPVCLSATWQKDLLCSVPGCPEKHVTILHPDPIQVHHLGFRWVVNSARKVKPSSGARKTARSAKMAGNCMPPSEIILELVEAEPVSGDEYDFEPDVKGLDTTFEVSDDDSLEEGEIRDDSDEEVQFVQEVIRVPSGSESEPDSEPETEHSFLETDEEAEEQSDSEEEDSGNDSAHSRSHFDSDDKSVYPGNDYRKMLTLDKTVTIFDQQVNICYDSSSTVSVLSTVVRIPGVVKDVFLAGTIPAGGGPLAIDALPLVTVPLPLEEGEVGVAQAMLREGNFPIMTVDPPPEIIARAMDLPPVVFTPRREGTVQLIPGKDNEHLWPHSIAISQDPVFSFQFLKSRIGGGLVYAGSVAAGWKNRRGIAIRQGSTLGAIMRCPPVAAMLFVIACLCLMTPALT
jgi:hypothetical protein